MQGTSHDKVGVDCSLLIPRELMTTLKAKSFTPIFIYTQYPIIRNGDQRWALEFLKNYQIPDADRFLILQGWALAVS